MAAEKIVLRHPEGNWAAVIGAGLLALLGKHLFPLIGKDDVSDVMPLILFWGIGFLVILAFLVRALAGTLVVRKRDGQLTISMSIGPVPIWKVRSAMLADLGKVAVRDHIYGYRGKKIHRYKIVYEHAGAQWELLDHLSRESATLLVEFLGVEER